MLNLRLEVLKRVFFYFIGSVDMSISKKFDSIWYSAVALFIIKLDLILT